VGGTLTDAATTAACACHFSLLACSLLSLPASHGTLLPPASRAIAARFSWLPSSPEPVFDPAELAQRASVGDAMRAIAGTASIGATAAGIAAERRPRRVRRARRNGRDRFGRSRRCRVRSHSRDHRRDHRSSRRRGGRRSQRGRDRCHGRRRALVRAALIDSSGSSAGGPVRRSMRGTRRRLGRASGEGPRSRDPRRRARGGCMPPSFGRRVEATARASFESLRMPAVDVLQCEVEERALCQPCVMSG
jgi:hypothetical protein